MTSWGLLPDDARAQLAKREWHNLTNLRGRLTGERPFPIRIPLKPPTGSQALVDLAHFYRFQQAWQQWPWPKQVEWQARRYRQIDQQQVPIALQVDSIQALIELLGRAAVVRSQLWEQRMAPLMAVDGRLYRLLIKHLATVEEMTLDDSNLLAQLLPQLKPGMGQGSYLRALPLRSVDTKFVEHYQSLIVDLLDTLWLGGITASGGLLGWLGCREVPKGWKILVRPLALDERWFNGLPMLQLTSDVLLECPLPASNIIVVENMQSGYALPALSDTIAVFGGGRNISWMAAQWLKERRIAYWGDIDSWGFTILSEARRHQPHLTALMMDEATLLAHQARLVDEPEPNPQVPDGLSEKEQQLFIRLSDRFYGGSRLEQERLSPDYVARRLADWHQH